MQSRSLVSTAAKIVWSMTLLAIAFGVLHDLFSAAVCKEYFTVHHPKLIESDHWLAMAFLWGFMATWWVGTLGGIWLAWCTQVGRAAPIPFKRTMRAAVIAAGSVLVLAPLTWFAIYRFGQMVIARNPNDPPAELDVRAFASGVMHMQSYTLAFAAFAVIGVAFVFKRYRKTTSPD